MVPISNKLAAIDSQLPPILQRLSIQPENWIDSVSHFQKHFFDAADTLSSLGQFRERKNRQRSEKGFAEEAVDWIKGKGASKKLYGYGLPFYPVLKNRMSCRDVVFCSFYCIDG